MSRSLLARAIAEACSEQEGLLVVQLPGDLPEGFAEELVGASNRARPSEPPYAILVAREDDLSDAFVPRVSRTNVIQFRKGSRLAVVAEDGVDLASFDGSYRQAIGPGFPAQEGLVDLRRISHSLLGLIEEDLPAAIDSGSWDQCVEALLQALRVSAKVFEDSHDLTQSWNGLWYRHVDHALAHLLKRARSVGESTGSEPFTAFFSRAILASFGLPQPEGTKTWESSNAVGQFIKALSDRWSDGSQIEVNLAHIRPLEPRGDWMYNWEQFDADRMTYGSLFGALQRMVTTGESADWELLTRSRFESPIADEGPLVISTAAGEVWDLQEANGPAVMLVEGDDSWRSPAFQIRVSAQGALHDGAENIIITTKPDTARFNVLDRSIVGNEIVVGGFLEVRKRASLQPLRVTLGIDAEGLPELLGSLNVRAQAKVVLLPSAEGLLAFPKTRSGLGAQKYLGPAKEIDEETYFSQELDKDKSYTVLVWGHEPQTTAIRFLAAKGEPRIHTGELAAGISTKVELGNKTFELFSPVGDPKFETPLAAAPQSETHSRRTPPEHVQAMIRGQYESFVSDAELEELLASLGHCVMPVEAEDAQDRAIGLDEGAHALAPTGYLTRWRRETYQSISSELVESAECQRFTEAASRILILLQEDRHWPSKTSWKRLREEDADLLDEYLNAYADLVGEAARYPEFERFWACFPFSVSVWAADSCVAVLLSPLHPLRLAWLAAVEKELTEADPNSADLAGVVEGWAFPLIGPDPTPSGRMLAIPSDSGPGEIFAAWSMMVPVSVNAATALKNPQKVLGQPAPGASPSGLTASAAEAALRDFQRAHPHVPSLVIDLSASADSPRLSEVDAAVLSTIQSWAGKTFPGVRVMDSLHRSGDLPRIELARHLADSQAKVTWSRYRPKLGSAQRSNLRLLQDSGAQVRVRPCSLPSHQVSGRVPLRRFWGTERVDKKDAFSSVWLGATGWDSFDRAIEALEATPERMELGIRLNNSYLIEAGADWTVSGEAFLSPGGLGSLLGNHGGSGPRRMLWEWRPPYLQGRLGGFVERRPYVITARVPAALERNLTEKLRGIAPDAQLDRLVQRVFDRLGTRGLGLSSLFARGDTHESGALGFYLAYELLDKIRPTDAIDIVLPLDACDTFLQALGGLPAGNASKRADLLLARVRRGSVVLSPIEIKFYGAGSTGNVALPHPGAPLREAFSQADTTSRSLQKALDHRAEFSGKADETLWNTAFATLIESGLRLADEQSEATDLSSSEIMKSLVEGDADISVGKPVILYFQHGNGSDETFRHSMGVEGSNDSHYGCLIARPREVFGLVETGESSDSEPLVEAWREVVAWATEVPDASEPEVPGDEAGPRRGEDEPDDDDARVTPLPPDEELEAGDQIPPRRAELTELVGEGIKFDIGTYPGSIGKGVPSFWPSNTRLNQMNIGVVGDLGTGKTQLLKALVCELRASAEANQPNPLSFLILDYKRDFQNEDFLEAVGGKVLRPFDIPLNPLALKGPYSERAAYKAAVDFFDVLQRIHAGIGPVQKERLTTLVRDLYRENNGAPPTLRDVYARYTEDGKADSVSSVLADFVLQGVFVEDARQAKPIDEILADGVVVVAINEFGTDQDGKNSLVALLLNEYYGYMTRQTKWPFEGSNPQLRRLNSFLLVDEAVNILRYDFEVLMNLLLQGREFGVGVILSTQFLNHFRTKKTNWAEPLLTWFVHKVPSVSQKELEKVGIKVDENIADAVSALEVHHALYKGLGEPGRVIRGRPFFELVAQRSAQIG